MRKATIEEAKKCPICGRTEGQLRNGHNRSGTQKVMCKHCKRSYTLEPKRREYGEEIQKQALKIYYAGASGRAVGNILGMSKANVYNWIKKTK